MRGALRRPLWALLGLGGAGCPQAREVTQGLPPTVILVSMDGMRWDYPERAGAPALARLAEEGVSAPSLTPAFPSKTFPNHYSLVTGLYPEHHGILDNTLYDPATGEWFRITDDAAVSDGRWWGGEPIWATAEKAGIKAATCFWPGSEAEIAGERPTYALAYDGGLAFEDRVLQVLSWLDLPDDARPSLLTLYLEQPDHAGHSDGPDGVEVEDAALESDAALELLISGLESRDLLDEVHIIVVSDHGMAGVSTDRVVFLDDYLDEDELLVVTWTPVLSFYPLGISEADALAALQGVEHLRCGPKADFEDLHFSEHPLIPPVICLADEGWSISSHSWFSDAEDVYTGGTHGYDPSLLSMHGIFAARGPRLSPGAQVQDLHNVDVYGLIASLLELEPVDNDGDPGAFDGVLLP